MSQQVINVNPVQLASILAELSELRIPACVWGPPGVGKSEIIAQSATLTNRKLMEFRAALNEPTDLKGFGFTRQHAGETYTDYAVPFDLPKVGEGPGILFADELNRATVSMQNTLMQLVLKPFRVGKYQLPDDWCIHAACNREGDGGGVQRMPGALADRFAHLYLEPDLDATCRWGFQPDSAGNSNLEPVVIAFLRFAPAWLCAYDRNEKANPNPRAWKFVSDIIRRDPKRDKALTLALVAGKVGHAPAIQFMAFLDLWLKLPNLDQIILNPTTAAIPAEAGTKYAVAAGLTRKATPQNLANILTYMKRLPDQEFTTLLVKDSTRITPILASTPAFTQWCLSNPL